MESEDITAVNLKLPSSGMGNHFFDREVPKCGGNLLISHSGKKLEAASYYEPLIYTLCRIQDGSKR